MKRIPIKIFNNKTILINKIIPNDSNQYSRS